MLRHIIMADYIIGAALAHDHDLVRARKAFALESQCLTNRCFINFCSVEEPVISEIFS